MADSPQPTALRYLPVFSPCFGEADIYYQEYADINGKSYLGAAVCFIVGDIADNNAFCFNGYAYANQTAKQVCLSFEYH